MEGSGDKWVFRMRRDGDWREMGGETGRGGDTMRGNGWGKNRGE